MQGSETGTCSVCSRKSKVAIVIRAGNEGKSIGDEVTEGQGRTAQGLVTCRPREEGICLMGNLWQIWSRRIKYS